MKAVSAVLALLVFGCNGATDQAECIKHVQEAIPDGTVHMIPNNRYRFIVTTPDDGIHYVETLNQWDPEVSCSYRVR